MKDLIIIGAGGMGRTLYDLCKESYGYRTEFQIKGFIDDNLKALDSFKKYPSIIGSISTYLPKENDVFVCSIGGDFRKLCMSKIIEKGGIFINLIHKTARIGSNVVLGKGNMIGAFTTVAADIIAKAAPNISPIEDLKSGTNKEKYFSFKFRLNDEIPPAAESDITASISNIEKINMEWTTFIFAIPLSPSKAIITKITVHAAASHTLSTPTAASSIPAIAAGCIA